MSWQTIETAPKDGTIIDVYVSDDEFPMRWTDVKWCKPEHQCISDYCDSCPDDMNKYAWREPYSRYEYEIPKPTHWMPLPEPPVEGGAR